MQATYPHVCDLRCYPYDRAARRLRSGEDRISEHAKPRAGIRAGERYSLSGMAKVEMWAAPPPALLGALAEIAIEEGV
jgi:hypothetical protein